MGLTPLWDYSDPRIYLIPPLESNIISPLSNRNGIMPPNLMKYLDLSFKNPAENLACDEALLDLGEEGQPEEILRFWESPSHFVVLGYSNKIQTEVRAAACKKDRVPIFRRPSGGGTVLQGPGCLNYSLILKIPPEGPLTNLQTTNHYILEKHRKALAPLLGRQIKVQGTSDLTFGPLKFSGNAQRRKRHFLLFHGTFLYDFDLPLIEKYLGTPSREPDYRAKRTHKDFVTNISLAPPALKAALQKIWRASDPLSLIPHGRISSLVREKYSLPSWNNKF